MKLKVQQAVPLSTHVCHMPRLSARGGSPEEAAFYLQIERTGAMCSPGQPIYSGRRQRPANIDHGQDDQDAAMGARRLPHHLQRLGQFTTGQRILPRWLAHLTPIYVYRIWRPFEVRYEDDPDSIVTADKAQAPSDIIWMAAESADAGSSRKGQRRHRRAVFEEVVWFPRSTATPVPL